MNINCYCLYLYFALLFIFALYLCLLRYQVLKFASVYPLIKYVYYIPLEVNRIFHLRSEVAMQPFLQLPRLLAVEFLKLLVQPILPPVTEYRNTFFKNSSPVLIGSYLFFLALLFFKFCLFSSSLQFFLFLTLSLQLFLLSLLLFLMLSLQLFLLPLLFLLLVLASVGKVAKIFKNLVK